jgi:benzoyl-CoA reductase/2-hydroxyglutaryl-CoA dehydratase subunit BcrC/BadD/HgdB
MNDERVKQRYLAHNTAQLRGLITFIEEQTGRKLDLDRLREIVERSVQTQSLICEIHRLRRAVPSPMPSEDQFACIIPQLYMLGSEEALDFYQRLHAEVKHRVENKIGVVKDEKFRLMWMGIPTWFNLGVFNYLESLGAPSVIETTYYVYEPGEVDTSDPVRALAEIYWNKNKQLHDFGAECTPEVGVQGAGLVVHFAREYKLDGVIMHNTRSCRAIAFGQAHTHKRLQAELGTPVLFLESDMADPRQWSDARIIGQINTFLELLASRKVTA